MNEKTYNIIQVGEVLGRTDDKERAIRVAQREAKANQRDVYIEERRVTMLIRPSGEVIE